MVDEEKVRLMTKCAIYEKGKGKQEIPIAGYFKSDYVRMQTLKTMLCVCVACIIMAGVCIAYNMDNIYDIVEHLNYRTLLFKGVAILLFIVIFYFIVARIVYTRRFRKVRDNITEYYAELEELSELYSREKNKHFTEWKEEKEHNDEFIDY